MMTPFAELMQRLLASLEVPGLHIPACGVRLYKNEEIVPESVRKYEPEGMTVTSCHAIRAAMLDDPVYLTKESIGCVAAAISMGLVEADRSDPMNGHRVYTEIMRSSSGKGEDFIPPSPADFTDGSVYACKDAGYEEFSLFGEEDSGRYRKREIATAAISRMPCIQPPNMQGIFYFSPECGDVEVAPDLVILSVRPVELCRIIQGYQFLTGNRVQADVGGLRAGCADLIVHPYLNGGINFSPYCLGARLIARFEGDRMGIGMPYALFETTVRGMEASRTGFPFAKYPDA